MHPRVHVLASATRGTQPDSARPRRSARSGCLGSRTASAPTGAAPTVSVRGRAVPIRRFPHTGNYFGAGPAVHAEVRISGTEIRRVPTTLINVCLPKGVRLHPQSFPTCPPRGVIEEREGRKCPKGSASGPPWKAAGVVAFGSTRVPEEVEIFSFYAPGGGFEFLTFGREPVLLEIPSTGHLLHTSDGRRLRARVQRHRPARRNGPRCAQRLRRIDRRHARVRHQPARARCLLRTGAEDMSAGRVPRKG